MSLRPRGIWTRIAARPTLAALACGVVMALGQPPIGFWPLFLLGAAALLRLGMTAALPGRVAWAGGFGYFFVSLYWIGEAFLVDSDTHGWMLPFAITILPAGLALFWALGFRLGQAGGLIGLLAGWAVGEYARSHVLTGFPWVLSGYIWGDTPVFQTLALWGIEVLSILTLGLAALLASLRLSRWLLVLVLVSMGWWYGKAQLAQPMPPDHPIRLRLVQPNFPQSQKFHPDHQQRFLRDIAQLSAQPSSQAIPDLVIWPENAIPALITEDEALLKAYTELIPFGTALIQGAVIPEQQGKQWFNSLVAHDAQGRLLARADKYHLVPFGEYVPLRWLLSPLGLTGVVDTPSGFTAAPQPSPLVKLSGVPPFKTLICYEAIFSTEILPASSMDPAWLLHLTNDAWFGNSLGPRQHLLQSRARAIEYGVPLVRVANTGISAVIDARGRVLHSLSLNVAGILDVALPARINSGFYSQNSTWLAPSMLLILLLLTVHVTHRRQL